MSLDEKLIDKRVLSRSLELGRVDSAEYQAMLDELPDLSDQIRRDGEGESDSETTEQAPPPSATSAEATGF